MVLGEVFRVDGVGIFMLVVGALALLGALVAAFNKKRTRSVLFALVSTGLIATVFIVWADSASEHQAALKAATERAARQTSIAKYQAELRRQMLRDLRLEGWKNIYQLDAPNKELTVTYGPLECVEKLTMWFEYSRKYDRKIWSAVHATTSNIFVSASPDDYTRLSQLCRVN